VSINRLDAGSPSFEAALAALLHYDTESDSEVDEAVAAILADVRLRGDAAVLDYTRRFDGFAPSAMSELTIGAAQMQACLAALPGAQRAALESAARRIRSYHEHQRAESWRYAEANGNQLGQQVSALDRVGLYVPGGKAAYPSSLLMNAIPARVAGVRELVMVSPTPEGVRNPLVLAAAAIAGIDQAIAIGGAQAIGALAYGTASIARVDKIVGPGNAYVAAAKRRVFGTVGIDMIAGPSEILVIADGSTPADWVAMDLFSQAEHDEVAQALLLCPDAAYIDQVGEAIERLLPGLARAAIVRQSLANRSALIKVRDLAQACELANRIAPEHLELSVQDPEHLLPSIRHAGAIFLGAFASEALGDYCAGPNHVLPTAGTARFSSPLGVYDFQKRSSVISISREGAQQLGPIAVELAAGEGLGAHAEAARLRLDARPAATPAESHSSGIAARVASVVREDVRAMRAYPVADPSGMVKLDAMENPYTLPRELQQQLAQRLAALEVNRYPSPRAPALRARLRAAMQIPADAEILLGNGSDELISLIAMAAARPGAAILAPVPGFVMYEVSTRLARLQFVGVPLAADFSLDMVAMREAIERHQPAVVYLAYPNNPTGTLFGRSQILELIGASPGLVVIDEAYQAFAPDSFLPVVDQFDNLAVMRTVSKSGLAGARLGYLAARAEWIEQLDRVRPPFNVNVYTQCAVEFALEHVAVLEAQAAHIRQARSGLARQLAALPQLEVFDSEANFILFRVRSGDAAASARILAGLIERRVLIKNLAPAHALLHNCLRVTVSSPEENAAFLEALEQTLAHESA
jgi:histidinol dehydrogenase